MSLTTRLRERWAALRGKPMLDAIIAHANPAAPLRERVDWAEDLFDWARLGDLNPRLKWFLQVLERQPEARTRVARTLRSLVRDTEALDLFADAGLPQGAAFTHEFVSRILSRLL